MEMLTAAEICRNAKNLAPLESQREYRERISSFIRMHLARLAAIESGIDPSALPGNSMLIIARTGCGKSFTISQLCKAAGISLITVDCSALTLTGYKGCNLGELLSAVQSQKSDEEFSHAVILFDEVDKMKLNGVEGNPQANFLKLFDGVIQAEGRGRETTVIDVSRMSFIFAGAFAGLDEIIRARFAPRAIGFSTAAEEEPPNDLFALATMADIRAYGFMDELLGRIGSLFYVPPLTEADYRTLLKGDFGSVRLRYANLFGTSGVALDISDGACSHIAREAELSAMGARAVDPLVYNCLQPAFGRIDEDETINRVTIACRNDQLTLRFGHGERVWTDGAPVERVEKKTDGAEKKEETAPLPDVSIAQYLKDDDGVRELLEIAEAVFDRNDTCDETRLRVFLRCCFHFMRTLKCEEDLVLKSVTKLADATQPGDNKESCFDRVVSGALDKKELPNGLRNELQEAYLDYRRFRSKENHLFWVKASKDLRRNWYRSLIRQAG